MAKGSNFRDHLKHQLLDPDFAAAYLAVALQEGDEVFLGKALAEVTKAHGASAVSAETGITRQALYKMLSFDGNPSFKNVSKLLDTLGFEITVQVKSKVS